MCLLFLAVSFVACDDKSGDIRADTPANLKVTIDEPKPNASAALTDLVKGRVSDPKSPVYVLVHPLNMREWWVQRVPSPPNPEGNWQAQIYLGTDRDGIGEEFEIVAVAGNRKLSEGERLSTLPSDLARSDVVLVRRVK
jgi:hypothetical protein